MKSTGMPNSAGPSAAASPAASAGVAPRQQIAMIAASAAVVILPVTPVMDAFPENASRDSSNFAAAAEPLCPRRESACALRLVFLQQIDQRRQKIHRHREHNGRTLVTSDAHQRLQVAQLH